MQIINLSDSLTKLLPSDGGFYQFRIDLNVTKTY